MIQCLMVGVGGFVGSVLRYLIGLLPLGADMTFPIKTFGINILGSFLIGLMVAYTVKNNTLNPNLVLLLKVGVCGGFTTFSTFALEMTDLAKDGNYIIALSYALSSLIVGILMIFLAQKLVYSV